MTANEDTMTAYNRIQVETLNQPSSRFPFNVELTKQKLSELLGWDPNGVAVAELEAKLLEGKLCEVGTTKVPRDKGTSAVEYRLEPLRSEH